MSIETSDLRSMLSFAEFAADSAANLIMGYFETDLEVDYKDPDQPVTIADRNAEKLIRGMIEESYPTHGIIGEEFGSTNLDSDFLWTIDPVDGTNNFAHGIPTFGMLLGLRYQGEAVLGVIDHPALKIRTSGGKGLGVTKNGMAVKIKDPGYKDIPLMLPIAISTYLMFEREDRAAQFQNFVQQAKMTQIYYDCFATTLAVNGGVAAAVEIGLKIWDLTPGEALVKEAGGSYVTLSKSLDEKGPEKHSIVLGIPSVVKLILPNFI